MAAELITQVEFARRVGRSVQRINQLVKGGRLPLDSATKLIPWVEGKAIWDTDRALAARAELQQEATARVVGAEPPTAPSGPHDSAPSALLADAESAALARGRKELARAKLLELELAERQGQLIPAEEVRADAQAVLGGIRAGLLALPSRVGLLCEGRTAAEVEAVVADAVNQLLSEWHRGRWGT